MVEGLEMICFRIISNVGGARSSYIEAIQKAKQGDFEGAREGMVTCWPHRHGTDGFFFAKLRRNP